MNNTDFTTHPSKIILTVSCQDLIKRKRFQKFEPYAVLFIVNLEEKKLNEFGRTESIEDDLSPQFTNKFIVPYTFEKLQLFRIIIFNKNEGSQKYDSKNIVGIMNFSLGEVIGTKESTITNKLIHQTKPNKERGFCTIKAEETKKKISMISFRPIGQKLDKKDFFGHSDPFLLFEKQKKGTTDEWEKVHQTEKKTNTLFPKWRIINISLSILCDEDLDLPIKISCYDWNKTTKSELIGFFITTTREILNKTDEKFYLIHPKKQRRKKSYHDSGKIKFKNIKKQEEITFLSYFKMGIEMNLVFSIDFTASNGHINSPNSLHYTDDFSLNQYQESIMKCGSILSNYCEKKKFPVYGFGARIDNNISHCFSLTGNSEQPEVEGIQGVMDIYKKVLGWKNMRLWGPTHFAPIINGVAQGIVQNTNKIKHQYFVLLFITDGEIEDFEETKKAIVYSSALPLSIVIIGVGNNSFEKMKTLDSDFVELSYRGTKAVRDIVQFVPFKESRQKGYEELARRTLEEIPRQVISYFERKKIYPPKNDQKEK
ncbi:copine-8 [Anaeramoeba flamelloides]|uniref:Copine-8 n=1 Tax=Anaeramoeba flamelloides TaxID=1746091 RepID=A0ABQ8Y1U6_9EUKA|nr:copine-8 [Anaeramoeba flamelloides]